MGERGRKGNARCRAALSQGTAVSLWHRFTCGNGSRGRAREGWSCRHHPAPAPDPQAGAVRLSWRFWGDFQALAVQLSASTRSTRGCSDPRPWPCSPAGLQRCFRFRKAIQRHPGCTTSYFPLGCAAPAGAEGPGRGREWRGGHRGPSPAALRALLAPNRPRGWVREALTGSIPIPAVPVREALPGVAVGP